MLYITVTLIFVSALLMSYFVLVTLNKNKIEMAERISAMENIDKTFLFQEEELGESVSALVFKGLGSFLIKFSPSHKSNRHKKQLEKAGILKETTAEKWVARKAVLTVIVSASIFLLTMVINGIWEQGLLFSLLTVFIINTMYRFYLSKRITKRTKDIVKSLPFTLDLITVSVEAGLSLDGAIGRIVGNIDGPLSDEFGQTLKEIRMGIEKRIALKNMSERVGNRDLSMLISSLIQAEDLGVSLGKILRIEGDQLREKRKQAAREKAMKAPIKMLFPLMIFIFPTIFVIILGPAVIQMIDTF